MECPNQRSNEFEQNSTQFARQTSRFVIIFKRFIWNFVLGFGVCSIASEGIVMANESTICSLFQEGVGCNPVAAVILCRLVIFLLTFTKEKMGKLIGHNADADRKGSILAVYAIIGIIHL